MVLQQLIYNEIPDRKIYKLCLTLFVETSKYKFVFINLYHFILGFYTNTCIFPSYLYKGKVF